MFGINFPELVVCLVVALIVIGPEQLPETVRSISLWIGRMKRSLRATREEFERQVGMDDIRRQLHNEEIMQSLEEARKEIHAKIEDQQNTIHEMSQDLQKIYTSEPDLPYHSHMEDPNHGKTPAQLPNQLPAQLPAQVASSEPATTPAKPQKTKREKSKQK